MRSENRIVANALASKNASSSDYSKELVDMMFKEATSKFNEMTKLRKEIIDKLSQLSMISNDTISLSESAKKEESKSRNPRSVIVESSSNYVTKAKQTAKASTDAGSKLSVAGN